MAVAQGTTEFCPLQKNSSNGHSPTTRRLSSSSGSSDATPSLSSEEFHRLHREQGVDLDLGSEAGNVADIFGQSDSFDYNDITFSETSNNDTR